MCFTSLQLWELDYATAPILEKRDFNAHRLCVTCPSSSAGTFWALKVTSPCPPKSRSSSPNVHAGASWQADRWPVLKDTGCLGEVSIPPAPKLCCRLELFPRADAGVPAPGVPAAVTAAPPRGEGGCVRLGGGWGLFRHLCLFSWSLRGLGWLGLESEVEMDAPEFVGLKLDKLSGTLPVSALPKQTVL